jgi:hypothetical protein
VVTDLRTQPKPATPDHTEPPPSPTSEICEWCKSPVRMMCQKGTEICSQLCAKYAAKILFDDPERAKKFGGGHA